MLSKINTLKVIDKTLKKLSEILSMLELFLQSLTRYATTMTTNYNTIKDKTLLFTQGLGVPTIIFMTHKT
jgi:hypothetical protein